MFFLAQLESKFHLALQELELMQDQKLLNQHAALMLIVMCLIPTVQLVAKLSSTSASWQQDAEQNSDFERQQPHYVQSSDHRHRTVTEVL